MLDAANLHVNHDEPSRKWPLQLVYFLLFLMLAFPSTFSLAYGKMALFAVLLFFVVIQGLTHLRLHHEVVLWTIALAVVSLSFSLRGLLLRAPGAFACLRTYAVWPLIYLLLLSGVRNMEIFRGFKKTMVFSALFISLFGIYFALSQLGFVPHIPFEALLTSEELGSGLLLSVSFYTGHVVMEIPGENSLPFLVPFLFAIAGSGGFSARETRSSRLWLFLALFLSLTIVILSGRRGLQLVTMLAPLLTLGLGLFRPLKERQLLIRSLWRAAVSLLALTVLALPLLSSVHAITFEGLADRFTAGFDFSSSDQAGTAPVRVEQYFAMMKDWEGSPFFGRGLGASAHGSIRSSAMPWAYELSYLALLLQTGLVGFAAYTAGIIWIYWTGTRVIRQNGEAGRFMLPLLVGMSGLLIANGTNPYLARFDGIWAIFLPLALINHWLVERDRPQTTSSEQTRWLPR